MDLSHYVCVESNLSGTGKNSPDVHRATQEVQRWEADSLTNPHSIHLVHLSNTFSDKEIENQHFK